MKSKYYILAFVFFLILSGASCDINENKSNDNSLDKVISDDVETNLSLENIDTQDDSVNEITVETQNESVKEFNVKMSKYMYEPSEIVVNKGDKVIIHATSLDVAHGFYLLDFNLNLMAGKDETVTGEFIADKVGEFEIRCSVYCGLDHNDMHAKFIVK